ncbi:hypothetical protein GGX14DRAFT_400170 [Mycena pura]|uniref:Uncharacterized protein n=1 Tax=Mycena pura TaxID=153505 RepID=A0AAD6Y681_9AGAR|nr:hypothetical protein GGX14DRAFT_400170 [Mycena pura]
MTFISIPPCTTLQHQTGISEWREACHSQALQFTDAVKTTSCLLSPFMYTGAANKVVASGDGTLYHGIWHSKYSSFARREIDPTPYKTSNYFSPAPSFNLTDLVEKAVLHVLHGSPSFRITGSNKPVNLIMVLAFPLKIGSIVGAKGTNYISMGVSGGVLNQADANWITSNSKTYGSAEIETISKDWIIGPFLMPIDETCYRIGDRWMRSGRTPVRVAAVSEAAFKKLNSSVVAWLNRFFVEKEDRPDEAT